MYYVVTGCFDGSHTCKCCRRPVHKGFVFRDEQYFCNSCHSQDRHISMLTIKPVENERARVEVTVEPIVQKPLVIESERVAVMRLYEKK